MDTTQVAMIDETDLDAFILRQVATVQHLGDDPAPIADRAEQAVLAWAQTVVLHLSPARQNTAERRALEALALARNVAPDVKRHLGELCIYICGCSSEVRRW